MKLALFLLAAGLSWAQCPTDANGICTTTLSSVQNNLLGPLIPYGNSPWLFGDLAEKGIADYMAPLALAATPTLGAALPGTVSGTNGSNTFTTTSDLRTPLLGQQFVVFAWDSVDGAGTGRTLCPINTVSSTTIVCYEPEFMPNFSGVKAYLVPPPAHGVDLQSWTTENPGNTWDYYDVGIGLDRLWIRTNSTTYRTYAQQYADINWQWNLDHGYRVLLAPRAASMIGQFFRVGEGHTERLPGLYQWISTEVPRWVDPSMCPNCDNREGGYVLWDIALGAKVDTDPTRHAQYCSWLTTYVPGWNAAQAADGSWPEKPSNAQIYVGAPKAFSAPLLYGGAPWREAINVKAMEAAYESLNDTSSQGCNNPTLAAATLTVITKAVTWQHDYGLDTANRGIYYEVNSQSNDQLTVSGVGTASVALSSTSVTGVGTNWNTSGYCDGTHFIGFWTTNNVYKIGSCSDDTHATLTVAYGLYSEGSNLVSSGVSYAPSASTSCGTSLATYCYTGTGDRNLTRTVPGGIAWLYAKTLNATYKSWSDLFVSSNLGGPTAGLTSASNAGSVTLPCSGPGCDGLVTDTSAAAENCNDTTPPNTAPCIFGVNIYTNLGKNNGEAWGAPALDNALADRLYGAAPVITSASPLPSGTNGAAYSYQFTASGLTPITWAATGLPGWASLASSGLLSGTAATGTTTFNVTATNSSGNSGAIPFSLTIVNAPPAVTCSPKTHVTPPTATDIQLQTNMALSIIPCTNSLTGSGCTVVDVQRVVNAALGGACVVGP